MHNEYQKDYPAANRVTTRIENDIEMVKSFSNRVRVLTSRNIETARHLGYYEPSTLNAVGGPQSVSPVVTNLADALRELSRELDSLDGSFNLFN